MSSLHIKNTMQMEKLIWFYDTIHAELISAAASFSLGFIVAISPLFKGSIYSKVELSSSFHLFPNLQYKSQTL